MNLSEVAKTGPARIAAGLPYSADWSPVPVPVVTSRPVVGSIFTVSQSRGPEVDDMAAGVVGSFDINDLGRRRLPGSFLFFPFERQPVEFQPFPMHALPLIGNGIVVGCGLIGSAGDVGQFDLC